MAPMQKFANKTCLCTSVSAGSGFWDFLVGWSFLSENWTIGRSLWLSLPPSFRNGKGACFSGSVFSSLHGCRSSVARQYRNKRRMIRHVFTLRLRTALERRQCSSEQPPKRPAQSTVSLLGGSLDGLLQASALPSAQAVRLAPGGHRSAGRCSDLCPVPLLSDWPLNAAIPRLRAHPPGSESLISGWRFSAFRHLPRWRR